MSGNTDFHSVDFSLPKVDQPLLKGKAVPNPKIFIGMPKWGSVEWVGNIYPPKTKAKEFLDFYGSQFNGIELNATHYKIHPEETILRWTDKVADKEFIFCPKMFQGVTHRGSLDGKKPILDEFLNSIDHFGDNLGPILCQVPETLATKRKEELIGFLQALPPYYNYFLEIRHDSWFSSAEAFEELVEILKLHKIGLIITDTPERRDVLHMRLTIPRAFIRFRCCGNDTIDKARVGQWKRQLKEWFEKGLESCCFFIHLGDVPIDFAKYVQDELGFPVAP